MGRLVVEIDTDQFDDISTMLARALENAANRVRAGNFEHGRTHLITVDGKGVGTYRHVAPRTKADRLVAILAELERCGSKCVLKKDRMFEVARNDVGGLVRVENKPGKIVVLVFDDGSVHESIQTHE